MGVWPPNVRRIALVSAFAPSTMNKRQTDGAQTAADQVIEQCLGRRGALRGAFDHPERMLRSLPRRSRPPPPAGVRSLMWMPSIWIATKVQLGQVRGHPFGHAVPLKVTRSGATAADFERAIALHRRNIAAGQAHRAAELARRDVDQHQVHRPSTKPILRQGRLPARQRAPRHRSAHAPEAVRPRSCRRGTQSSPSSCPSDTPLLPSDRS